MTSEKILSLKIIILVAVIFLNSIFLQVEQVFIFNKYVVPTSTFFWIFNQSIFWFVILIVQIYLSYKLLTLPLQIFDKKNKELKVKHIKMLKDKFARDKDVIIKKLLATRKEIVNLSFEPLDIDDVKLSKLGGKPYWPIKSAYPKDRNGEPMLCLMQINLKDLFKNELLPSTGVLQFFISCPFRGGYSNINNTDIRKNDHLIVFHRIPEFENSISDWSFLPKLDETPIDTTKFFKIKFELGSEIVNVYDSKFENIVGSDIYTAFLNQDFHELDKLIKELNIEIESKSKIGGYPNFIQQDIKLTETGNWIESSSLLLQLSSDDRINMRWGDQGNCYFFVNTKKSISGDFSDTAFYWDCY